LTGNADGKKGIFSCWINSAESTISSNDLMQTDSLRTHFFVSTNVGPVYFVILQGFNAATTLILSMTTAISFVLNEWHHFLASWDLSNTEGHLYVDDIERLGGGATLIDDTIAYSTGVTNYGIGASPAAVNHIEGDLAEYYFNNNDFLDFSVKSNRRKFITRDLHPVYLGEKGARPTGNPPIIYQRGDSTDFITNLGSGGGMTETGTLADAAFTPGGG